MHIDSHQHFWNYETGKRSWLTDDMKLLQKDFLPEAIQPTLQQHKIEGCIAVQSQNAESENDFLLQLADANDFIKGIVAWTDLQASNLEQKLVAYSRNHLIKGFRHIPQAEEIAVILSPAFRNGLEMLSKNGFTYDILADTEQLRYAYQLATQLPNQKFVIDHMGKPPIGWDKTADWKRNISQFGPLQNVYCKVPGISHEANGENISSETVNPFLDIITAVFGTSRLMYGSNWPVCLLKTDYETTWNLTESYFQSFSDSEKKAVFGGNAKQFYNL